MNRYFSFMLLFIFLFPLSACAGKSITVTVLDAETHEPIEGAVAIVYWKQTEGIGLTSTTTVAAIEQTSDENGRLVIPAVSVPINAHPPEMKVYKQGYLGWSSKYLYQGSHDKNFLAPKVKKRTDFYWGNQKIYLEIFKKKNSYTSHGDFLQLGLPAYDDLDKLGIQGLFQGAINWEAPFAAKELKEYYNKERK